MIPPEVHAEIEAVVGALRRWMLEAAEAPEGCVAPASPGLAPVDLHAVVRELSALRGEVRVESRGAKASRETLDRAAESLAAGLRQAEATLSDAEDSLRDAAGSMEGAVARAIDPVLRDRDRLRDDLARAREAPLSTAAEALLDSLEALRRGRTAAEEVREGLGWRARFLPAALFDALLEGHDMALRRIQRALASMGIEEIPCRGRTFDPGRMRAVETEAREDLPPGQVIDVLRPGFVRGDRVLRFAEVRTALGKGS